MGRFTDARARGDTAPPGPAWRALPPDLAARASAHLSTPLDLGVIDDQAALDAAARDLPTKERYDPPKMDEATARRLHPELFKLPP
jgi:hypothetical protein